MEIIISDSQIITRQDQKPGNFFSINLRQDVINILQTLFL